MANEQLITDAAQQVIDGALRLMETHGNTGGAQQVVQGFTRFANALTKQVTTLNAQVAKLQAELAELKQAAPRTGEPGTSG